MVYLAIAPMVIGFLTWGYALVRTTAGRMGSTTYLALPIAILLGWLLLGETPPLIALVMAKVVGATASTSIADP